MVHVTSGLFTVNVIETQPETVAVIDTMPP